MGDTDEQEYESVVLNRLKLATTALRDAFSEIEALKSEKADLTNRLKTMETGFRSRMETQRLELENVQRQFAEARSMLDGCLVTINSSFQAHAEKSNRVLEDARYENKLLADQLAVQKLKCTHLSKRVEAQSKQLARLKLVNMKLSSSDK